MKAGQEASFAVQLNGARGLVDAKIHSPSGATEECYVSELDSGEMVSSVQSELGSSSSSSSSYRCSWRSIRLMAGATTFQFSISSSLTLMLVLSLMT